MDPVYLATAVPILAGAATWLMRLDQRVSVNEAIRTSMQAQLEKLDHKTDRMEAKLDRLIERL